MRVVEYDAYGAPDVLVIRDVEDDSVMKADEVCVRVAAASVNPKDTFVRKGRFRAVTGEAFPRRTGYDFSGVVEAVASPRCGLSVGQRVFGMLNDWAGGACAEQVIAPALEVAAVSSEAHLAHMAALPLAGMTALQALCDGGGAGPGARVLVNGASGGVGLFSVQIAKALGAEVTAVASTANAALCRDAGADAFVDYQSVDVLETASAGRFDVVFDVFGNRSFEQARRVLSEVGIYVSTVPSPQIFTNMALTPDNCSKRARLVSVHSRRPDLERLAGWITSGDVRPEIDSIFELGAIAEAHRRVETKHTRGKVLVTVGA